MRRDNPRNKLLHSLFSGPSHHRDGHAKSRRRRYSSSVVYVAVKRRVVILVREIFFFFFGAVARLVVVPWEDRDGERRLCVCLFAADCRKYKKGARRKKRSRESLDAHQLHQRGSEKPLSRVFLGTVQPALFSRLPCSALPCSAVGGCKRGGTRHPKGPGPS